MEHKEITQLKRVRLAHKKTLTDTAAAIGIDAGNLSRIENGQVPEPATAEKIVRYFRSLPPVFDDQNRMVVISELQILYPDKYGRAEA